MTHSKRTSTIFPLFVVIICLALSVTLADLFSSVLTVGLFSSDSKTNQSFEIYAVSLLNTQVKTEANEFAKTVQTQGGSGYVWMNGNSYHVFASAYEQENDATLVRDNLLAQSVSSETIKLTFLNPNFKEEYSNEEMAELGRATTIYKTTFKKLYDVSVSLDTALLNETQAKLEVGKLLSEITKGRSDFETLFSAKKNSETVCIGVKYKDLLSCVQKLSDGEKLSEFQTYSSLVKWTYVKALSIYSELANELAVK